MAVNQLEVNNGAKNFAPAIFAINFFMLSVSYAADIRPPEPRESSGSITNELARQPQLKLEKHPARSRIFLEEEQKPINASNEAVNQSKIYIKAYKLIGNTLLDTVELESAYKSTEEHSMSIDDINAILARLASLYRKKGYLAEATVPEQDITDGILTINITEAKLGRVIINEPSAKNNNSKRIGVVVQRIYDRYVVANEFLDLNKLETSSLISTDITGVNLRNSLSQGIAVGTTDVIVDFEPIEIINTVVSTDNTASVGSGSKKLNAQLALNTGFGFGDQWNIFASRTSGSEYIRLGTNLPFVADSHFGRFDMNLSKMNYTVLQNTVIFGDAPHGDSSNFSLSYHAPISKAIDASNTVDYSLNARYSNDFALAYGGSNPKVSKIYDFSVSKNYYAFDNLAAGGLTNLSVTALFGYLLLPNNEIVAEQDNRIGTSGNYKIIRFALSRNQNLSSNYSLFGSISGQLANKNLDSSQKFSIGGSNAVRAYPGSEGSGSNGLLLNIEFKRSFGDNLSFSFFNDFGIVKQYINPEDSTGQPLLVSTPNNFHLQGRGIQILWRPFNSTEIKAVFSRRVGVSPLLTDPGLTDTDGTLIINRYWITLTQSF